MQLLVWAAIVIVAVAADQITKMLAVKYILPAGFVPFIDRIIGFRYTENKGAAFGMMSGFRWGFIIISFVGIFALAFYLIRERKKLPPFLGISFAMIIGGGIGNQIDRIANGFVVDFLEFQFIDFAIFNVADCFVTVGAFLALLDILLFHRDFFSEEKKEKDSAASKEGGTSVGTDAPASAGDVQGENKQ